MFFLGASAANPPELSHSIAKATCHFQLPMPSLVLVAFMLAWRWVAGPGTACLLAEDNTALSLFPSPSLPMACETLNKNSTRPGEMVDSEPNDENGK